MPVVGRLTITLKFRHRQSRHDPFLPGTGAIKPLFLVSGEHQDRFEELARRFVQARDGVMFSAKWGAGSSGNGRCAG